MKKINSWEYVLLPVKYCVNIQDGPHYAMDVNVILGGRTMKNKSLKKNIFAHQAYRQAVKQNGYAPASGEKMKARHTK